MVKTISISDEEYKKIKEMKQPGESFSEVISRLIERRTRISDIAHMRVLTEEEAENMKALLAEMRLRRGNWIGRGEKSF